MKKDTRQDILQTAKKLFNERGYNGVSLRDIADALGISKGNLTYHFAKKEEIVEALLESSVVTKPKTAPTNIKELDVLFLDMQQIVQENAYYFLHYVQLSQLSPIIREKQGEKYLKNIGMLKAAFALLYQNGLLREEGFSGEYERIIDCLHMTSISWKSLSEFKGAQERQGEYRNHAWGIMHNLLTEQGRAALDEIIKL